VTVPRNINKADAVALVSSFGSLRHAVNAAPEQVAVVGGWGEKKVRAWCRAVEEPFRVGKAGRRGVAGSAGARAAGKGVERGVKGQEQEEEDDAEALVAAAEAEGSRSGKQPVPPAARTSSGTPAAVGRKDDQLSDGVAAALARLRERG
jgi:DNA excision repair protein ERCC-1